jgi:hypothetical protein
LAPVIGFRRVEYPARFEEIIMKPSIPALVTLFILAGSVSAEGPALASETPKEIKRQTAPIYKITLEARPKSRQPSPQSLREIASWLSAEFGLSIDPLPEVEFVSKTLLGGLRFRGVSSDHLNEGRDVLAVYDDEDRMIYLPRGWTGRNVAETSILVHELVHHAQNLVGEKSECLQSREKMAYEAQQRWLAQSGSSLEEEFGIDGFTLLVRTNCGF